MFIFPLDEDDVIHPFSPPVCEVEEAININNEYFEDPVEFAPTTFLLVHKEMVNFIHTEELMKEPLEVVDEHIDTFIHIGRHRCDMSCFIFYEDPVYDIEVHSQINDIRMFLEDVFL
jgi:hypothetical protein